MIRRFLPRLTRPQRSFYNSASIATAIPILVLIFFVLPRSSDSRISTLGRGQGTASLGLLKPITITWESPLPTGFWSATTALRDFTIHPLPTLLSLAILSACVTLLILFARWDTRTDRLVGRCDECGFSLVGHSSDRCPECGTPTCADRAGSSLNRH